MNNDWECGEDDVELEDDMFIEIYAESESDLLGQLAGYSMDELKTIARCVSRQINHKLHGHKLIGDNYMVEKIRSSLDCCAKTPAPKAVASIPAGWVVQNCTFTGAGLTLNSMESDMNTNTDYGHAETRRYLLNRLSQLESEKYGDAETKFLPVTEPPKDGKALKEAIANGWLKVNVKDDDKLHSFYNWSNYVELQDPAKPRDRDAYDAAVAKVAKGKTEAKDAIMVLPQADGLLALKAFEGTTYH